ncbi:MAG: hypothetical protein EA398_00505 [Deltaproteobacteria bacterium]|nr:MAG: hypothetical protein EA398_00505 [Deltaproteobacteria bacterium]
MLWRALAAAVGSALLVSALAVVGVGALLGLAVVVVLPAFVGLLLRIGVVGVALRATRSPLRKLLLRWVPRSMFIVSLWGFAQAPVPLWNAVALPVTTAMLVLAVGHYCRWQLEREAKGIPVHRRERWLLITVVALALALAGLLVLTAVFIGWSIHHALGALFPD